MSTYDGIGNMLIRNSQHNETLMKKLNIYCKKCTETIWESGRYLKSNVISSLQVHTYI